MVILCSGMMRSGSTLQFNLVRRLLEVSASGVSHGFWDGGQHDRDTLAHWSKEPIYHLLKTHAVLPEFDSLMRSGGKACYIYRDLRDVAASAQRKFPITSSELIGLLDNALEVDARMRDTDGVLVQRYEDVIDRPDMACGELARYLHVDITSEACNEIALQCGVQQASRTARRMPRYQRWRHGFDVARVRLLKHGVSLLPESIKAKLKATAWRATHDRWTQTRSQADAVTLLHPDHISPTRGQPGAWRSVLSPSAQEVIGRRYATWLMANRYVDRDNVDARLQLEKRKK